MIREAIISLSKKQDLTYETAGAVMNEIMTGEASPVQMSAYLTALSLKGETTDEITASAYGVRSFNITPEQFGFKRCAKEDLQGGTPSENAEIIKAIFRCEKSAKRDAAILNAAVAMFVTGKYESIEAAVKTAEDVIDSGRAMTKPVEFIRHSNEVVA